MGDTGQLNSLFRCSKNFFENGGVRAIEKQQVIQNGIALTNYIIKKKDNDQVSFSGVSWKRVVMALAMSSRGTISRRASSSPMSSSRASFTV